MSPLAIATRSLLASPGFTIVSLLTLALGIGVNTSMFSFVDAVLFRSAPFPQPEEIVQLTRYTNNDELRTFSDMEIREIRAQDTGFASLATIGHAFFAMAEPGQPPERVHALNLSAESLEVLRVQPMLGRNFRPEEFEPGRNQVVLLSESFWRSRFASDPDILDRTLRLDGEMVTVIGVMPASAEYRLLWGNITMWRPLNFTRDQSLYRAYRSFMLIGRLAPGESVESVAARLAPLAAQQEKEHPRDHPGVRYAALPLHEAAMDDMSRNLSWMLLGLSGFVLLIGCANLANLQLARTTASLKDYAIRAALGASRTRLILHQLGECVLLALAGGALGVLVAHWCNHALENTILIDGLPGFGFRLDPHILAATLGLSALTGVIFGIVPALLASRADVGASLKQQNRGSTTGRGTHHLRHALIVGEVALALVLLGGAAILNRSFARTLERDIGWDSARVLTASIAMPEARFDTGDKRVEFFRRVEARLQQVPGVESVALASSLPLFIHTSERQVFTDESGGADTSNPVAAHVMVTPDYFTTLGMRLIEGRLFPADVREDGPRHVVVNESLARRFWPGESAVGKRLASAENSQVTWQEVIGVVADVEPAARFTRPPTDLIAYRPLVQEPWSYVFLAVRSEHPEAISDTVRRAFAEVDPDLPMNELSTVAQFVERVQRNLVILGHLLIGFALLGLVLAGVGIYGVISNLVAQRTAEIGIRIALGAQPTDVLGAVLRRGLTLTSIGLALGLLGAAAIGRLLQAIMPRLVQSDPAGVALVALVLLAVAVTACWIPARRATKIDPLTALRGD